MRPLLRAVADRSDLPIFSALTRLRRARCEPSPFGTFRTTCRHTEEVNADLNHSEVELLIAGLTDDVAFVWVLIHLGLRGNPPAGSDPPSEPKVDAAFAALDRLAGAGLLRVGRMEYINGGPPGRVAPVKHVEEPTDDVRARVSRACLSGVDWEWSCWVVNTDDGDEVARRAIESR